MSAASVGKYFLLMGQLVLVMANTRAFASPTEASE